MDMQERRQDHFNKAYLGVIAQGGPSYDRHFRGFGGGACLYHGPDGRKCNVGYILTEEELSRYGSFLGEVADLWRQMGMDYDHPFYSDADFYDLLQDAHDSLHEYEGEEFVHHFEVKMMALALEYNLQLPEVPSETATA